MDRRTAADLWGHNVSMCADLWGRDVSVCSDFVDYETQIFFPPVNRCTELKPSGVFRGPILGFETQISKSPVNRH